MVGAEPDTSTPRHLSYPVTILNSSPEQGLQLASATEMGECQMSAR